MNIPFFTFKHMHPPMREEMTKAFHEFYDSGWYVLGKGTSSFEKAYADYSGVKHAIGVADGLDALVIALQALDLQPSDEVIVPSNTYIATWLAVTQVGATIVPVEPDPRTFNIDVNNVKEAITENTKVIMPVNLYGQPCLLEEIRTLADAHNIIVIEDNAQSQGAEYKGKKTGSYGHLNAVSFYPGKNLGALGEAGAITTDDDTLAEKIKALRNYGSHKKYHNLYLGRNARIDEFQARVLEIKLNYLDHWNNERRGIAAKYDELLLGLHGIVTPHIADDCESVFHQYIIQTDRRDDLQAALREAGIGTLIHYPIPPHLQPAYEHLNYKEGDFPIAEKLANTMLSLPIYPGLTLPDVESVSLEIRKFFSS